MTPIYPPPPGIGAFWHGPSLGWLERACLRSMMEQGHAVTLYLHDEVKGVPAGVQIRDAKEVAGDRPIVFTWCKDGQKSPTLYADQFRHQMIKKTGLIWVDLDAFLLKPLQPDNGYLFGYERDKYINNAILSLPGNSPTLADLIEFCEDYYPIPPFEKKTRRIIKLKFRKMIGFPIHVSRQGWGVWGPKPLTWFLRKNREDHYALPPASFHPIEYNDMVTLLSPAEEVQDRYLQDALSVHLGGSVFRGKIKSATIPKGSFLSYILDLGL